MSGEAKQATGGRAIAAAAVGNALEWYDFTVYALFAVYIAPLVFPPQDEVAGLIAAFMVFGVGFIARPVGAIVLGAYGDRAGRKAALTASLGLMALGTLCIAVTPPFVAIGIGAPLLLLCGRILQGLSAGGELGGALSFLVEHAPPGKRGVYAAWLQGSMAMSNILSALVATAVTTLLSAEDLAAWGWRIPFIVGLAIVPVGLWLRARAADSPEFERMRATPAAAAHGGLLTPLRRLLKDHGRALGVATGLSVLWVVAVYSLVIYMPTFVQRVLGFPPSAAFTAALVGNTCMAAACLGAGWLADRHGRQRVVGLGAVVLLLASWPLLSWLADERTLSALILTQTAFCMTVALFVGSAPGLVAGLFPVEVRSSGVAVSYNLAAMVFGGFAPAVLTFLTERAGTPMAPAWYVMGAAVVSLAALAFAAPEPRR